MVDIFTSSCGCPPEMERYLKKFCTDRVDKMGLYSLRSGACKSCPYRYRGDNTEVYCCMFDIVPMNWESVVIEEQ